MSDPGLTDNTDTTDTTVNGVSYAAPEGITVAELVAAWCPSPRGVAVALDGEVVPHSTWDSTVVTAGASVEIVSAAAGG
jgi:sulfur carrier protein